MIQEIFKNYIGMIALKQESYVDAARSGFRTAALCFLFAAIGAGLGSFWFSWDAAVLLGTIIVMFLWLIVGTAISTGIVWIFAKMFGGTGAYSAQYYGMSHMTLLMILYLVPFIGPFVGGLLGLWSIVMNVHLVKTVHQLTTGKAVAAVLIPYVILMVIALIIGLIVGMALFAMFSGSGSGGLESFLA